jgi:hypothetical protein
MEGDARAGRDEIVIAFAALLALAPAPAATAADSPRAFLTRLYARYESGNLNPFPRQESIYTPELVRQMRLNVKLNGPDQVGLIDYDPICQCQDMAEMKARIGEVAAAGPGRAEAKVSIGFGHQTERQAVRLRLVRTPAGWRIGDIATPEQPSLLADLQRDNNRLARGKRR